MPRDAFRSRCIVVCECECVLPPLPRSPSSQASAQSCSFHSNHLVPPQWARWSKRIAVSPPEEMPSCSHSSLIRQRYRQLHTFEVHQHSDGSEPSGLQRPAHSQEQRFWTVNRDRASGTSPVRHKLVTAEVNKDIWHWMFTSARIGLFK